MSARTGEQLVAGVDEAGRGPLAGPVVAAAVVLRGRGVIRGIDDSKKISAKRRVAIADRIIDGALGWSVAIAKADEIDELNILNATLLAMRRAVFALPLVPDLVRVDGNQVPPLTRDGVTLPAQCIVGGDASDPSIGAASILAKVWRDQHMLNLDTLYPAYGFARHKGYPTAMHLQALTEHGPCPEHRVSFRPVRNAARQMRT